MRVEVCIRCCVLALPVFLAIGWLLGQVNS